MCEHSNEWPLDRPSRRKHLRRRSKTERVIQRRASIAYIMGWPRENVIWNPYKVCVYPETQGRHRLYHSIGIPCPCYNEYYDRPHPHPYHKGVMVASGHPRWGLKSKEKNPPSHKLADHKSPHKKWYERKHHRYAVWHKTDIAEFYNIDQEEFTMRAKEMAALGLPKSTASLAGMSIQNAIRHGFNKDQAWSRLSEVARDPEACVDDAWFGELARKIVEENSKVTRFVERAELAPCKEWGSGFEHGALEQIHNARRLPVAVRAALMPDAHQGYGLPIGGVLAVEGAVIPYAVGMDIACRMKMTIFNRKFQTDKTIYKDGSWQEMDQELLGKVLQEETAFGLNAHFEKRRQHEVMDEDWSITAVTRHEKDKAWNQLGSSGSGNHFVEFGELTVSEGSPLNLQPGIYLALLSHSGSRGTGAAVANHFSGLAKRIHSELPPELQYLAWLDIDTPEGQDYWNAMELMGRYAAANHDLIHTHIVRAIKGEVLLQIENHHNFAWKEEHYGKSVFVHRKGATPAGVDVLGIIPGTMADKAYVVIGKGNPESLCSSSHGAGRKMSRAEAKRQFNHQMMDKYLKEKGVTVLNGDDWKTRVGCDESPMAYKNIDEVMEAQSDLVGIVATFQPRLVKMASEDERAED